MDRRSYSFSHTLLSIRSYCKWENHAGAIEDQHEGFGLVQKQIGALIRHRYTTSWVERQEGETIHVVNEPTTTPTAYWHAQV